MPFAPAVALELSTPAPKAPAAIVSTITQADGETAVKTASIDFPPQFDFNERFRPPRCQPEQEEAEACPPASQVGTVSAEATVGGGTGNVYVTQDFRVVAFINALGGAIKAKVVGVIEVTPTGGFKITFSGLPNLPLRKAVFAFDDGDLALVKNPARCGRYTLPLHFVSHEDEQADASADLDITGCPPPLTLTGVKVVSTRPVKLAWQISEAVEATRVRIQRRTAGGAFRTVVSTRTKGTTETYADLKRGRYRGRLQPLAGTRLGRARTVSFRVR